MASRASQTLGNAILLVTAELPAGSLGFSRDDDRRGGQQQPVEFFGRGTLERGDFAGSGPIQQQQDQGQAAERSGVEAERRAVRQELLRDLAVLRSEQFDQRRLRERFGQH